MNICKFVNLENLMFMKILTIDNYNPNLFLMLKDTIKNFPCIEAVI